VTDPTPDPLPDLPADPVPPARHLRVVTWNMNHWRQSRVPLDTHRAAWKHLADRLGADVVLAQEAVPADELAPERTVYTEIAGHRAWGSAIVALPPHATVRPIRAVRNAWSRRHHLLLNTHPGSVAIAELELPGIQPITLVSIYAVMDGSSLATMYRVLADLVPLFDSPQGARVIVAGDFNVSRSTADPVQRARADALLGALGSLGLVEARSLAPVENAGLPPCACTADGCGHLPTWKSAELDHVFLSPALASQVTAMAVAPDLVTDGLSDHVPLVLDLALTAEHTPHAWDEEAFAAEIGRRHGRVAREVVERLVAWADERERLLGEADGVRWRALTRFPTNGVTAEPELWFPLDFNLAPRMNQPTFSIKASGEVVMQFGGMRHPPFDTEDGRRPLLDALNAMTGVDLPRWQVRTWPRFPLAVLEDETNLARFVAVLDRIVTESRPAATPALPLPPIPAAAA
jgi:endonuclease/exonuclease/phosphatase family metal-dependent hydrolase